MSIETPEETPIKFTLPKLNTQTLVIIGVVILALIPSIYFYIQFKSAQTRISNPSQFASEDAKNLVATVSKLMTLPTEETPTVATVNDKEKLKNQPFFAKSENGDKVLIYTNAKKAILFRPSINKIIDVAPVNIGPAASASATPATAVVDAGPMLKFTILNGTSIVGLTKKYETELKTKVKNADVTEKDNAKSKTYEKTLLVDVKGTMKAEAKQLATELGIMESTLPSGEATPSGDFLIILGVDKQ